jgi:urease accessory protein
VRDTAGNRAAPAALKLMLWLSPAFPVGSFAYSHALEWAAEAGDLPGRDALTAWIEALLQHGSVRNDAVLLAASWRAAQLRDGDALRLADELGRAYAGSRERYLETTAQGTAFMIAVRAAWSNDTLENLAGALAVPDAGQPMPVVAYPVAVGLAAAAHDIGLEETLAAYLTAVVASLVSAAIRLSVIGQTAGQTILAALLPSISALSLSAAASTPDALGGCAFRSEIAAMRHETQYTRLFRT